MRAPGVAVALSAVITVAVSIKLLLGRWGGQAFDGLANVVSYSSKLIAASRAVESQEEHPLVADPLAEGIAGASAVANSKRRAQAAPPGSERRYKVGKMAIRTRWFDDQIEAALGMPVTATIPAVLRAPGAPPRIDLPSYVWTHPSGHEPRQLVMLGAGMDSRPWRMKLPADLHWFELDQPDVVEAKQRLLRQLAAEVPPGTADMADEPLASPGSGLSRHLSIDAVQFPLRCGSWTPVACDLGDPSWADALLGAGFDPAKPTVWVAEGLLMYLEEAHVRALLATAARLSPDGSVFVGLSVTQAVIDRIRTRGPVAGGSGLMETWQFGCPPDPTEFLDTCGWRLQLATDRARQAAALGLREELLGFPPFADTGRVSNSSSGGDNGSGRGEANSLFIVATPLVVVAN